EWDAWRRIAATTENGNSATPLRSSPGSSGTSSIGTGTTLPGPHNRSRYGRDRAGVEIAGRSWISDQGSSGRREDRTGMTQRECRKQTILETTVSRSERNPFLRDRKAGDKSRPSEVQLFQFPPDA